MKMLLKALSGLLARILLRPNPYGLTSPQKKLKAEIDAAVRGGATAIFCVPRRFGATYLAHIVHAEHGGPVVVPDQCAVDRFRREHLRMFGKRPDVVSAAQAGHSLRGRTGPVLMDACHIYPTSEITAQSAAIGLWGGPRKVEVHYDPSGYGEGRGGRYKARLASDHGIWDAGPTAEEAQRAFALTARSFGMSGDLADYDFVGIEAVGRLGNPS